MNERDEREWLLQEQARLHARTGTRAAQGTSAMGRDAIDEQVYREIALGLRAPRAEHAAAADGHDVTTSDADAPLDFAGEATRSIFVRRLHDRRTRRAFERVLGVIALLYAAALIATIALGALTAWRAAPAHGTAWIVALLLCATGVRRRRR